MLDFTPVRAKRMKLQELADTLTPADLRQHTEAMIATLFSLIAEATDAEVVFVPVDPQANDPYAANPEEANIGWTLGHVLVHTTASAEEAAFLSAEMARGVPFHGRSRYETPWETVTTIAQCRARLAESRRMRLAALELWPDQPHLDITHTLWEGGPTVNALGRFLSGLYHEDSHLDQIREILRQAREKSG